MELIVVTRPDYFVGEAELLNQLFEGGLRLLHLRKPENDAVKFRALMEGIDPQYYHLISIHQHHELAGEFGLSRLHFKEQQRREVVEDGFHLSTSVHDLAELAELDGFSYVFFGPVFNSISKQGYNTVLPEDFVLPDHPLKVIAIGGVQAEKLKLIRQMNFNGAAVLGSLWHSASPLAVLQNLIKSTYDHR